MGIFASLLAVVVLAAGVLSSVWIILGTRLRYLRRLAPESGLRRLTATLFDTPPVAKRDAAGRTRLEGTRDGEPLAIEAAFTEAASRRYMRTGYKSGIGAEVSVVVDLLGATPALSFETTRSARTSDVFDQAWRVAALDDDLRDDGLRDELMRFVGTVPSARSVVVGREGLRITWLDDAGTVADPSLRRDAEAIDIWEKGQRERLTAAAELAARLRKRILGALERRAKAQVRVEAYRSETEAPAERDDVEADSERRTRTR